MTVLVMVTVGGLRESLVVLIERLNGEHGHPGGCPPQDRLVMALDPLEGAFLYANLDLVATIFGAMTVLSRIVYTLVGLAAIYVAVISPKLLK